MCWEPIVLEAREIVWIIASIPHEKYPMRFVVSYFVVVLLSLLSHHSYIFTNIHHDWDHFTDPSNSEVTLNGMDQIKLYHTTVYTYP